MNRYDDHRASANTDALDIIDQACADWGVQVADLGYTGHRGSPPGSDIALTGARADIARYALMRGILPSHLASLLGCSRRAVARWYEQLRRRGLCTRSNLSAYQKHVAATKRGKAA